MMSGLTGSSQSVVRRSGQRSGEVSAWYSDLKHLLFRLEFPRFRLKSMSSLGPHHQLSRYLRYYQSLISVHLTLFQISVIGVSSSWYQSFLDPWRWWWLSSILLQDHLRARTLKDRDYHVQFWSFGTFSFSLVTCSPEWWLSPPSHSSAYPSNSNVNNTEKLLFIIRYGIYVMY